MLKMLAIGIIGFQCMLAALNGFENQAASEEQINNRIEEYNKALNQGDNTAIGTFWTNEAQLSNPATGELINGKDAITQFMQKRAKEIKDRQLTYSFKPTKIEFTGDDSAIVIGVAEVSGKQGLIQRNARRVELIKQNGQWLIDAVSEIEVAPAPQVFQHLKDIEWLVGNWKDEDDDVSITFNTEWDKFKNFIIQKFKMEVYGSDVMTGTQIIGWDPIEKRIRSWIFDSDGGYGDGKWTKNGNSWNVNVDYVLTDGKKASATNVYTKVDDKSYSYASIDRKIDGQAIPNVEPVTVEKEQ